MSDQNINTKVKRKFFPRFGFFRTVNLFFGGLGLCFLFSYPGINYLLEHKETELKEELRKLRESVGEKSVNEISTIEKTDKDSNI
jgi:hypothetical protein